MDSLVRKTNILESVVGHSVPLMPPPDEAEGSFSFSFSVSALENLIKLEKQVSKKQHESQREQTAIDNKRHLNQLSETVESAVAASDDIIASRASNEVVSGEARVFRYEECIVELLKCRQGLIAAMGVDLISQIDNHITKQWRSQCEASIVRKAAKCVLIVDRDGGLDEMLWLERISNTNVNVTGEMGTRYVKEWLQILMKMMNEEEKQKQDEDGSRLQFQEHVRNLTELQKKDDLCPIQRGLQQHDGATSPRGHIERVPGVLPYICSIDILAMDENENPNWRSIVVSGINWASSHVYAFPSITTMTQACILHSDLCCLYDYVEKIDFEYRDGRKMKMEKVENDPIVIQNTQILNDIGLIRANLTLKIESEFDTVILKVYNRVKTVDNVIEQLLAPAVTLACFLTETSKRCLTETFVTVLARKHKRFVAPLRDYFVKKKKDDDDPIFADLLSIF